MEQNSESRPAGAEDAIIIDLGKKKRKDVKRLRKGEGKLMDEVKYCVEELRDAGAIEGPARPVIVVVREKAGSRRWF
jgi:hypothetical protein